MILNDVKLDQFVSSS
jgi:hypothetical protein